MPEDPIPMELYRAGLDVRKLTSRAGLTKRQKKQVERIIKSKQELKYHNVSDQVTVNDTGTVFNISQIAQGDTDQTRDGDALLATSIHCKFQVGRADNTNMMRVILFRWLAEDTSTIDPPTMTKILQTTGSVQPMAQLNHDFRSKFQVLYDRIVTVDQVANDQYFWQINKKLAKVPMRFSAGTTNGKNKIWMLAVSDSSTVTDPSFLYDIRINYTDS